MNKTEIVKLIQAALPDAEIAIDELADDGDHYAARITSAHFRNKSRLEQHKLVYDALGDRMGRDLHALALQTFTPDGKAT